MATPEPVAETEAELSPELTRRHRLGSNASKRLESEPIQALFDEVLGVTDEEPEPEVLIDLTGDDGDERDVVIPEIIDVEPAAARGRHLELLPTLPHDERNGNGVEIVDERAVASTPAQDRAVLPKQSRALRITTVKSNGRRRWAVDFLVPEPDADENRE